MKKFETPEIETTEFAVEDIMTISTTPVPDLDPGDAGLPVKPAN